MGEEGGLGKEDQFHHACPVVKKGGQIKSCVCLIHGTGYRHLKKKPASWCEEKKRVKVAVMGEEGLGGKMEDSNCGQTRDRETGFTWTRFGSRTADCKLG